MKRVIKRLVWDMCYESQQHLSEGTQSVLVKKGPWQFSYRLWVEDVDGFTSPPPLFHSTLPLKTQRAQLPPLLGWVRSAQARQHTHTHTHTHTHRERERGNVAFCVL
jgi:hypothetical protein